MIILTESELRRIVPLDADAVTCVEEEAVSPRGSEQVALTVMGPAGAPVVFSVAVLPEPDLTGTKPFPLA